MSKRNVIRIILLTLLVISIGTLGHSATINITTTRDNAAGSLREAITTASSNNEDDTIQLPAGTYILTGAAQDDGNLSGDLDINTTDSIAIIGDGAGTTIIDGNQIDRVLHILNGTVSISGVTIQNGKGENEEHGGGIYNSGTLTLTHCIITNNNAGEGQGSDMFWGDDGGSGGGIYNPGQASLYNCTIYNNSAGNGGETGSAGYPGGDGGSGGGIYNQGTIILTNCTVYGNNAGYGGDSDGGGEGTSGNGGGICNTADAITTLTHCTITANSTTSDWAVAAGYAGGIYNDDIGTVYIENTIISNNPAGWGGVGTDCFGTFNSRGYNLILDTATCTVTGTLTGNLSGVDPMLDPLADNGGATQTCALLPGSPAIDAGDSSGISQDQRGFSRPVDIPGINNAGDGADMGAYEVQAQYTISGTVTANGTGLAGVTLTFSNNGGTTAADDQGNYSHTVSYGWSGTVTPSKEDYSFTPANREYTNVTANQPNQDYTANPYSVSISITNPQDGAIVSGIVTVSTTASSGMDSRTAFIQAITKIEFYIDDILVHEDTTTPYQYSWDTTAYENGTHTIKVKAYNSANQVQESQITVTVENEPSISHISLNRTYLNFGADTSGIKTGSQDFLISNTGEGILEWTISGDADWLSCTPTSGIQSGIVTASIDPSGLQPGTYNGTVTIEAPYTDNSPQTIAVTLKVYDTGSTQPPFGSFDAPPDNSTVMSSVPVTGWVLDDIQAEHVKIFREPLAGEGNDLVYIGEAIMVEGARTDIETAYPDYPLNYKAGWGYMMLTNFLPNQGNGTFTLHATASDKEGNTVTLGTKTITCDNANAVKPFGAIDTPAQGGTASGSAYANFGWALTPLPNTIPTDGSTITVWVDGVPLGNPVYNRYREDIAALFPGYNNSDGAVGLFYLDTTQYENGVHTIAWTVEDDAGNADGIGSRYFTVQNSMVNGQLSMVNCQWSKGGVWKIGTDVKIPFDYSTPVQIKKGYKSNIVPQTIYPDDDGTITIEINQLERVEIHLGELNSSSFITHRNDASFYSGYSGYQQVGHQLKPLPIGSTFDPGKGIFYWLPGPACIGNYEFVFIQKTGNLEMNKWHIIVRIESKLKRKR